MPDYLKRGTAIIESMGNVQLEIRQLSAKAQTECLKAYEKDETKLMAGAIAVKYGVVEWNDKTPEEILEMINFDQIREINEAVDALDPDVKKSGLRSVASSSS